MSMNTEARDPISRGLDELARLSDNDLALDRMAGITRKARANRRRRVGAGVIALAVIAVVGVGAAQVLSDGDSSSGPGFADDESPPPTASGLTIDLKVHQAGPTKLSVRYRIHGTASAWSPAGSGGYTDVSGPRYTSVLLDGQNVGGTDGGDIECRAGAPELAYDETFDKVVPPVTVPGLGTYTVTVEAPYCGADGKVVPNEVSRTVILTSSEPR
jgi:hypothetical protein